MLYPTISKLTKDEFNRYELALATAKCARVITDEYVKQKEAANKAAAGAKDSDKSYMNLINKDYRDEKAVKNAINGIHRGEFKIVRTDSEEYLAAMAAAEADAEALEASAEETEAEETAEEETAEETAVIAE